MCGDHLKKAKLLKKWSTHLTEISLSCAISEHRQFCPNFATAVKENERKRLVHQQSSGTTQATISQPITKAMVRRELTSEFCSDGMPTNWIVVVQPKSFGRFLTDCELEATVRIPKGQPDRHKGFSNITSKQSPNVENDRKSTNAASLKLSQQLCFCKSFG